MGVLHRGDLVQSSRGAALDSRLRFDAIWGFTVLEHLPSHMQLRVSLVYSCDQLTTFPGWKVATIDFDGTKRNFDSMFPVSGVNVGWIVVVRVDRYGDAVKPAKFRHV